MKRFLPTFLFAVSALLFIGPYPAYRYFAVPYANTTQDPDAIEFIFWFSGIFLMLFGAILFPIAIGIWLYRRRHP